MLPFIWIKLNSFTQECVVLLSLIEIDPVILEKIFF